MAFPFLPGTPPLPNQPLGAFPPVVPCKPQKLINSPPSGKGRNLKFEDFIEVPRIDKPQAGKAKKTSAFKKVSPSSRDMPTKKVESCCYCLKILSDSGPLIQHYSGKSYHEKCSPDSVAGSAEDAQ